MADCPTGALVEPGRLDARRCLAWLLQAPGPFPAEYREALGDRIYGCDECQERCPVNRRAQRSLPENPPAEPGAQAFLPVLQLLDAGDEELEGLVGRWYIPGRDLRYVRRNALIVLGNVAAAAAQEVAASSHDAAASQDAIGRVLARYLASADVLLRSHAVWAARRCGRDDLLAGVDASDPLVAEELARRSL
jgi:epoxyqueuosine reductase